MVYNDYGKQLHAFIDLPQQASGLSSLKQDCIRHRYLPGFLEYCMNFSFPTQGYYCTLWGPCNALTILATCLQCACKIHCLVPHTVM